MKRFLFPVSLAALVGGGAGFFIRSAVAAVPATNGLTYSGRLTQNGAPLNATRTMQLKGYAAETDTTATCVSAEGPVDLKDGYFSISMENCRQDLMGHEGLWVEVNMDQAPVVPRTRVGAVPYAVEASAADDARNLGGTPASGFQKALAMPDCGAGKVLQGFSAGGVANCVAVSGNAFTQWNNQLLSSAGEVSHVLMTAPANGYALVTASGGCAFVNGNQAIFTIETTPTSQTGGPERTSKISGASCTFGALNVQDRVPVTAGLNTFYLVGVSAGAHNCSGQLSATYFPNAL